MRSGACPIRSRIGPDPKRGCACASAGASVRSARRGDRCGRLPSSPRSRPPRGNRAQPMLASTASKASVSASWACTTARPALASSRSGACISPSVAAAVSTVRRSALRARPPIILSTIDKAVSVSSVSRCSTSATNVARRRASARSRKCCTVIRNPSAAKAAKVGSGTADRARGGMPSARTAANRSSNPLKLPTAGALGRWRSQARGESPPSAGVTRSASRAAARFASIRSPSVL